MIKIDENKLIQELYYQRNAFRYGINDIIKNDYGNYSVLNNVLGNIYGKMFPYEGVFYDTQTAHQLIKKHHFKELEKFIRFANNNEENLHIMLKNFNDILTSSEFNSVNYITKVRRYSEKDFMDIIYSYFSLFGDKIYSVVKRYFDENRIQLGYEADNEKDYAGFFSKLVYLNSGYIISVNNSLDTRTLVSIAHELGHAIDAELFHFPQQKTMATISDTLIEVSSTFFEFGMYDYLMKNRIDCSGPLLLYNNRFEMLRANSMDLKELYESKDVFVQDNGDAVITNDVSVDVSDVEKDENGNIIVDNFVIDKNKLEYDEEGRILLKQYLLYPFRDDIIYSIGYYTSLHLNMLKDVDMKDFLKKFNNVITSRKESTFEETIEKMGISFEDYLSGKLIKDKVESEVIALKKRYKVY